ncbi:hypothetical protein ACSBR2_030668 [Camellia fascicularis]
MLFDVPGYKKFEVDSDDDIKNMLCLAKLFGLNHIDVLIQARSVGEGGNVGVVDCLENGVNPLGEPNFGHDDQMDLLPTYCPNKSKTFLSAQWASWITHHAVEHGFQFKCIKNDSVRITVVCKFAAATGCVWSIHARVLPSNGVLCVKSFDSVHTCGVAVRTYRNLRTGSELVFAVVADRVRGQPLVRPTDVVFDLKNDYGLDISYRVAWFGVEKARGEVYGDHAMSFNQLRWYNEAVMEKNPNSYINLEFDQKSGRFVQYFILFRACIDGFNHCRPLLFLDGTFLKGRFKGNLLAATNLNDVVGDGRMLTFISDRHVGLLQSMPNMFPSAYHDYCLFHLQMNLRDRMKYINASHKIGLMRKLRDCTYAPTVSCFNNKLEVLKKCSPVMIENFMKDLHPKHWANAGQRYGEMCSNATESFNNWVSDAHHLFITKLVDMVRG